MIKVVKKKINMGDELKTKIDWSCRFAKHKYEIYEGCLRIVEHTNLSYIEPHRVIIKGITFLVFNYSKILYINNLSNSIEIKDLKNYIKKLK